MLNIDAIINERARIARRTYGYMERGKYAGQFAGYWSRNDPGERRLRTYLTCVHPYESLGVQMRSTYDSPAGGFVHHYETTRDYVAALVRKWKGLP